MNVCFYTHYSWGGGRYMLKNSYISCPSFQSDKEYVVQSVYLSFFPVYPMSHTPDSNRE